MFYKLVCKYSNFFEKIVFLSDYAEFYKNTSLYKISFFQKYFLIAFYTPFNFKKVTIFFLDIDKIYNLRFHKHTIIHNFYAKEMSLYQTNIYRNKYTYSIIKSNYAMDINTLESFIWVSANSLLLDLVRYSMFWKKLSGLPNHTQYFNNSDTFVLVNTKTVTGFVNFLSKDFDIFTDNKLKKRDVFHIKYVFFRRTPVLNVNYKFIKSNFEKILLKYNKFYSSFSEKKNFSLKDIIFIKNNKIEIENYFAVFYKNLFSVKYKPTDVSQYLTKTKSVTSLFLRKNKIFNKGRYSRNRQLYRTGVYWCLWLNIINVFGLYYYFYRFVFNFGYFYIPLLILILSIFGSRLIKYRFYNPKVILNEFNLFIYIIYSFTKDIIKNFFLKLKQNIIKLIKLIYRYIKIIFN